MAQTTESPAARGALAGPLNASSSAADNQSHTPQIPAFQGIFAPFRREIAEGCFRLAALKLVHAADNIAIGDDLAAWPAVDCAGDHFTEGVSLLREVSGAP